MSNTSFCGKMISVITFYLRKVEKWFWCHRVALVKPVRMIYNVTQKGQFQNLTSGEGRDLTKIGHLHIIRCVLMRQTHWRWLHVCICSQSGVIVEKLQVTSDDVIMTSGDLAEVNGENLHLGWVFNYGLRSQISEINRWFLPKMTNLKISPLT